ncbi:acyl-ACP--UDP-N-acetylglucosamine O-acyltransferase [Cucumibacter marinus]|uniref:acyl-ACP--UDP-N-acetylglucosamine O-acyltransferase n=1 Tax=Cucumibacter marinus TaxID=1121252 RepID=UPI000417A0B5|nr:acyl-ACP--UDP-N-acetylglucosamine O-acyltransferase [Cucumibacter marinus]
MTHIHPTAIVGSSVRIGENVRIGPYCVVDGEASLGENVELKSHVVVTGNTEIGAGTTVYPFASIGSAPQDLKFRGEHSRLVIGSNCTIREHVTLNPGTEGGGMETTVGDDCLLMVGAHVAHDCHVGSNVILANNVTLAGHVTIEDHAIISGLVGIIQFLRIGKHAFVGAQACIRKDVLPYAMVSGNPPYMSGINVVGLKRRGFTRTQIHTLRAAYKKLFTISGPMHQRAEALAKDVENPEDIAEILAFLDGPNGRAYCTPRSVKDFVSERDA